MALANLTNAIQIELSNNNLSGCLDATLKDLCDNVEVALSQNTLLPWLGDFEAFCNSSGTLSSQVGTECSDGNPTNGEEEIIEDCTCALVVGTSNLSNTISIYPNPVNSKLILEGLDGDQFNYAVYNLLGIKVKSNVVVNNEVYVNGLNDGIFLFEILTRGGQRVFLEKIIVKRN